MATTVVRQLRFTDILIALGAGVAMNVGTVFVADLPPPPGRILLWAAAGVLVFRRRWPVAVMWLAIALGFLYTILGYPGAVYTIAIVIGIYSAAAQGRRWMAVSGVVTTFVSFTLVGYLWSTGHLVTGSGFLWFPAWLTVAVLLGEVARSRADRIASIEQRAVEAERTRQEEARRKAGEERMRIARELHDVLAHSISIINVQAGAAAHHLDTDPEKTRVALAVVRNTGKEALQELRSSLGVLRGQEPQDPALRPSPGMADLDGLVASARDAGQVVDLQQKGDLDDILPDIALTVYRIIQESLTNVTRHGGAANATVVIERHADGLKVTVENDGVGASTQTSDGLGIAGMRERAAAHGGHLEAGPRPGGGFRVTASIPLEESS